MSIAEATSPAQVVEYSAAVTDELVRWLGSIDEAELSAPPANGRAHLALSPRYGERAYRWEVFEDPDDMTQWPVWQLPRGRVWFTASGTSRKSPSLEAGRKRAPEPGKASRAMVDIGQRGRRAKSAARAKCSLWRTLAEWSPDPSLPPLDETLDSNITSFVALQADRPVTERRRKDVICSLAKNSSEPSS